MSETKTKTGEATTTTTTPAPKPAPGTEDMPTAQADPAIVAAQDGDEGEE